MERSYRVMTNLDKQMNKDKLKELKDLLNEIYWQGTAEGSEYSCGIDEDKIEDVIDWITSNFISKEEVKGLKMERYPEIKGYQTLKVESGFNMAVDEINSKIEEIVK